MRPAELVAFGISWVMRLTFPFSGDLELPLQPRAERVCVRLEAEERCDVIARRYGTTNLQDHAHCACPFE